MKLLGMMAAYTLLSLALCSASLAADSTNGARSDELLGPNKLMRPNVLMICIDDLNDWVGHLGGHPQARTPNIDALAARGRVFANAHCVVPVCSPSRISVISGLHATTHGSYELGPEYTTIERLKNVPTMHGYFKRHGYTTISGGKVLHHDFVGRLAGDIDRVLSTRRGGPKPRQPLHWTPPVWDYGAFPETDDEMFDLQLAKIASETLQQEFDQPFFLSVGFYRPHVPMYVPPKWFDLFDEASIVLPAAPPDDLDDIPNHFKDMPQVAPTHQQIVAAGQWAGFVRAYLASTSFADHCVGTVMAGLDRSPHRDNTIVVLWSDHGFHLGEKQHWAKRTLWEESTRVPLIIVGPGIVGGTPCHEAVSLLDIYPTLVEMCGLPSHDELDGTDLAPQLTDPAAKREKPVIISSYEGNHAVRSRDWRYIRYADSTEELYDHRADQAERTNLARDPEFANIRSQLAGFLPANAAAEVIPMNSRESRDSSLRDKQMQNRPAELNGTLNGALTPRSSAFCQAFSFCRDLGCFAGCRGGGTLPCCSEFQRTEALRYHSIGIGYRVNAHHVKVSSGWLGAQWVVSGVSGSRKRHGQVSRVGRKGGDVSASRLFR